MHLPRRSILGCSTGSLKPSILRLLLTKLVPYFVSVSRCVDSRKQYFSLCAFCLERSLSPAASKDEPRTIGVLDIFGFEDQKINGFEQLFINSTNEALQAVFNDSIFRAEVRASFR